MSVLNRNEWKNGDPYLKGWQAWKSRVVVHILPKSLGGRGGSHAFWEKSQWGYTIFINKIFKNLPWGCRVSFAIPPLNLYTPPRRVHLWTERLHSHFFVKPVSWIRIWAVDVCFHDLKKRVRFSVDKPVRSSFVLLQDSGQNRFSELVSRISAPFVDLARIVSRPKVCVTKCLKRNLHQY